MPINLGIIPLWEKTDFQKYLVHSCNFFHIFSNPSEMVIPRWLQIAYFKQ